MFGRKRKREASGGAVDNAPSLSTLQEENANLQRAVDQLSLLNDLSQAIGLSKSADVMIQAIVCRAKRTLEVEQVMIYFVEHTGDDDILRLAVSKECKRILVV